MTIPFSKVLVVGVGLIGGSIAAAIKASCPSVQVWGVDPLQESLDAALASGALDAAA